MKITVNLRHLEHKNVRLKDTLAPEYLDVDTRDEMVQARTPLDYDLEIQQVEGAILVTGRLHLKLHCQCVRCLKPFSFNLKLDNWTLHLPLEGEESAPVTNDLVDLTPYVREDILLEFPQHPLCDVECGGLAALGGTRPKDSGNPAQPKAGSPAWNELDKLKFND